MFALNADACLNKRFLKRILFCFKKNLFFFVKIMGITPVTLRSLSSPQEIKVLVCLAIGPKGMIRLLIKQPGHSVNKKYKKDCIQNILISFLREQYPDEVFWADFMSKMSLLCLKILILMCV